MKILKFIIAALVLLNLPSILLVNTTPVIGSLLSYATIIFLVAYYVLEKKTEPNAWMIILALFYFIISSFQYYGTDSVFILTCIKYFIVIVCGFELIKNMSKLDMFFVLLIGGLSIGIEALFFPSKFGRYSGFYINPNTAGFICIYAFALTYGLKSQALKLIGQFVFTLMGLLTFSRTFIVIWILLNLMSLRISVKNIRMLGLGFLIISTLFLIDEIVGLSNPRFQQLKNIVTNEKVSTREISEDSRTETWALFYDQILESPIVGNGWGTLSGMSTMGVHNSFLMVLGEAGFLPFFIMLAMFFVMFRRGYIYFKLAPHLIMQTIALFMFLLANHNFFNFYYITFCTMWIQYQLLVLKNNKLYNLQ
ncbi:O-antigen ligase family protein [Confluentibacter citreus]|uniref:O-antigen ligase family protein n=1 Tax=Confluentibacter citreus TaxID=2007307 RepID=UPI000C28C833|nr:O-antigen ligase family protein [Confluentibacter citreus]